MIHVLQIGFGPLGIQTAKFIAQKKQVKTVAVIDINTELANRSLQTIDNELSNEAFVFDSVEAALKNIERKPDVAIITTVSSLEKLIPQINEVAKYGIPVISTCEELSYPWELQPDLSAQLDALCKEHGIACLGTGVNPGFLMDYLPSVLSSVCQDIEYINIERIQDATSRRVPFQQKIGAGLDLEAFKARELEGTLRHVGLQESIYLLANSMGVKLDRVTEDLQPVISSRDITTKDLQIKKGDARGVEQIGYGYQNGSCKIKMHFKAAIGEKRSYDKITIKGSPSFTSEIDGGVNGDIATCAIAINSVKSILKAPSGLLTMADIGVPGYVD
ncbi:MAG: hypothetical protein GY931_05275 [Maribacter sp.]|nr:hypothetical protein [Maribacter sp.]